jgi:hypothetical protein
MRKPKGMCLNCPNVSEKFTRCLDCRKRISVKKREAYALRTGNVGKPGRKPEPDARYAKELGIAKRTLHRLGGRVKLMSLSEDARAVLLNQGKKVIGREFLRGGLAGRGYESMVPGKMRAA